MFERFTEQARQVVVAASEAARELKHNYVGTEHLLVGLLTGDWPVPMARHILEARGLTREYVVDRIRAIISEGSEPTTGQIPMTPRAKKVLELSLREALSLGDNHIGTEHILLGLVREHDNVGARILDEEGITASQVREDVIRLLSRNPRPAPLVDRRDAETGPRCGHALALFGALFVCQGEEGHDGDHGETGNGWEMRWEPS